MTNNKLRTVPTSDPSMVDPSAQRYQIERAWRQIRNGGTAPAAGGEDRELSVSLGLIRGDSVEARSQLAKQEKRDGRGDTDIRDETTN